MIEIMEREHGTLPDFKIREMFENGALRFADTDDTEIDAIDKNYINPASLDVPLGNRYWRMLGSKPPQWNESVEDLIAQYKDRTFELNDNEEAVLERDVTYIFETPLVCSLGDACSGHANNKSSTGRINVHARTIVNNQVAFDELGSGFNGRVYVEVRPKSFSVLVRPGITLNQFRFYNKKSPLGEGEIENLQTRVSSESRFLFGRLSHADITPMALKELGYDGRGAMMCLDVDAEPHPVGFRALPTDRILNLAEPSQNKAKDFWDFIHRPMRRGSQDRVFLYLYANEFYVLSTKEILYCPPDHEMEMLPFDHRFGDFRCHYAGFFDPGFVGTATLEVLPYQKMLIGEDGQRICTMACHRMKSPPQRDYRQRNEEKGNHYFGQYGPGLSKYFPDFSRPTLPAEILARFR